MKLRNPLKVGESTTVGILNLKGIAEGEEGFEVPEGYVAVVGEDVPNKAGSSLNLVAGTAVDPNVFPTCVAQGTIRLKIAVVPEAAFSRDKTVMAGKVGELIAAYEERLKKEGAIATLRNGFLATFKILLEIFKMLQGLPEGLAQLSDPRLAEEVVHAKRAVEAIRGISREVLRRISHFNGDIVQILRQMSAAPGEEEACQTMLRSVETVHAAFILGSILERVGTLLPKYGYGEFESLVGPETGPDIFSAAMFADCCLWGGNGQLREGRAGRSAAILNALAGNNCPISSRTIKWVGAHEAAINWDAEFIYESALSLLLPRKEGGPMRAISASSFHQRNREKEETGIKKELLPFAELLRKEMQATSRADITVGRISSTHQAAAIIIALVEEFLLRLAKGENRAGALKAMTEPFLAEPASDPYNPRQNLLDLPMASYVFAALAEAQEVMPPGMLFILDTEAQQLKPFNARGSVGMCVGNPSGGGFYGLLVAHIDRPVELLPEPQGPGLFHYTPGRRNDISPMHFTVFGGPKAESIPQRMKVYPIGLARSGTFEHLGGLAKRLTTGAVKK